MMSIPFQVGIVPDRWKKVLDIMLEKTQVDSRCHRLRIIALLESNLNHAKRVLIGCCLLHLMEDNHLLTEMQFGSRPGQQCTSAVLKKVLCHDHVRLLKQTEAFVENDAVGCYNRLINNLILMVILKLGLSESITTMLGTLWDTTFHLTKTIYGASSATYGSTSDMPLYGPGQGSMCGPLFWLFCYWLIVESFDPSIPMVTYISACCSILIRITGVRIQLDSHRGRKSMIRPLAYLKQPANPSTTLGMLIIYHRRSIKLTKTFLAFYSLDLEKW
jgi:hypothetical protein